MRGLHTGVVSGITQIMMPARERFRSLDGQEYWALIAGWTFLATLGGTGILACLRDR